ncbi:MAG: phytanoyl-CoA dioxygenase family protein [Pseudobdellovibrio sp.]
MDSFKSAPDAAKQKFFEDGFLIDKNFFELQELNALIQRSHEWDSFKSGSFQSIMNPHKFDDLFLKALSNKFILEALKKIFEGPVSAVQSQFFYGPPGCSGYTVHQDNFFLQADPRYFVSVWTSLEATSSDNGGLIVYKGSQHEPILPVEDVPPEKRGRGQDPNSDRVESVFNPARYEKINISTQKGESVFIHANLLHASHKNSTVDRFRHVLLCTYIKTGTPFRAGQYAKREELPLP